MRPHDLLRLKENAQIASENLPEWALRSLRRAPFVVVRRQPCRDNLIPIGIRGDARAQRHPAFVRGDDIERVITTESLAVSRAWCNSRRREHPAFSALDRVSVAASAIDLSWGPGGSAGFELATGTPALTTTSDLDIVVYPEKKHGRKELASFRDAIGENGIRVDVLIETTLGAVALDEWIASPQRVLIKTLDGPRLGEFSW